MSIFGLLQKICENKNRVFKNFEQLEVGEYAVEKFELVDTKFGCKLRVKTKDFYICLPDRFAEFINTEEQVNELNGNDTTMKFNGKDQKNKNKILLEFTATNSTTEKLL